MSTLELLDKMETLMHFRGNRGYGWYARATGANNYWGFGATVAEACQNALDGPRVAPAYAPATSSPVRRERAQLAEAPEPRPRRRTLFD